MQRLGHSKSLISWILIAKEVAQNRYQETGFTRAQPNDRRAVIALCYAAQCAHRFNPYIAMADPEVTIISKCSASLSTAQKK
jgi:hypothetical protein